MGLQGTIIQMQDFSVHDGDGIRTTIFFAGCPLRCKWCANPESWSGDRKLAFFQEKCTECGLCAKACPQGLLQGLRSKKQQTERQAGQQTERQVGQQTERQAEQQTERQAEQQAKQQTDDRATIAASGRNQSQREETKPQSGMQTNVCQLCGRCVKRCPQGALSIMGESMSTEQVVKQVQRDSLFYGRSEGGVTFSGGEATIQEDFLRELSGELYNRGISMWMETCGAFDFNKIKDILRKLDHIFYDIKLMDNDLHREMTGMGNELILENCKRVYELGIPMTLRIPSIPEVNLTEENLRRTAEFISGNVPDVELELLPYHDYGVHKYAALHLGKCQKFSIPAEETMEWAETLLKESGINVVRYR